MKILLSEQTQKRILILQKKIEKWNEDAKINNSAGYNKMNLSDSEYMDWQEDIKELKNKLVIAE